MNTTPAITREIAQKVRDVVDVGLVSGLGAAKPGKLCVEAAVCLALGLPHGDDPGCVAQSLRKLKIRLNDAAWSSSTARAAGLRRLAVAQLGSAGALDETEFVRRVVDMTIRKAVPVGLRAAAGRNQKKHAAKLEAAAVRCETEGTREAALAAAARAYARAAAAAYADARADADAARAAVACADAAAAAHAYADADAYADAACAAAVAAVACADAAAAAHAYAASARDRVLAEYAEWIVEILIDLKAPGCEWLDLVPKAEAA